jgi:hypothetical protein
MAGAFGITRGRWTPSVSRTITEVAGSIVEQAINDIATLDAGFDWEIDPLLRFNSWPVPSQGVFTQLGRGQNTGLVLKYGDNVSDVQRAVDATQYANVIRFSANFTTGSDTVDIVSQAIYGGAFGQAGRWEHQDSNNNITDTTTLAQTASAELIKMATIVPTYQMTLTRGWWNPTILWLGDVVTVNVWHGRLGDTYQARVSQIDVYVGDAANEETIVVTVGPRYQNLLWRITQVEQLLTQVSKTAN